MRCFFLLLSYILHDTHQHGGAFITLGEQEHLDP